MGLDCAERKMEKKKHFFVSVCHLCNFCNYVLIQIIVALSLLATTIRRRVPR